MDDSKQPDGATEEPAIKSAGTSASSPGGKGKRPNVISFEAWKCHQRPGAEGGQADQAVCLQKIRLLSTQQKQALLLRYIVSDDITDRDLNALLLGGVRGARLSRVYSGRPLFFIPSCAYSAFPAFLASPETDKIVSGWHNAR
jgi:hypothetical protein